MQTQLSKEQEFILADASNGVQYVIEEIIDDLIKNDYYFNKEIRNKEYELISYVNQNLKNFKLKKQIRKADVTRFLGLLFPEHKNKIRSKKGKSNKKYDCVANLNYGVYGIYVKDKLIYIGRTYRQFEERFEEHLEHLEEYNLGLIDDDCQILYKILSKYKKEDITFKKIINVNELKTKEYISIKDISMMELALIHLYKPIGNTEGVITDYIMRYN